MSYDVSLVDKDGKPVTVPRHEEGGTYAIGGICVADLNITYNYCGLFGGAGIELPKRDEPQTEFFVLHGSTGRDSIVPLAKAVTQLGTQQDSDYWKPTPGNAGFALSILLGWAVKHPDATWKVT